MDVPEILACQTASSPELWAVTVPHVKTLDVRANFSLL